jgi:hypothetical protein
LEGVIFIFIAGHYHVDLLQLQMVIEGYHYNYKQVIVQQLYQLWKVLYVRCFVVIYCYILNGNNFVQFRG